MEGRVSAWIRECFNIQNSDNEKIEMMDKLASYYLDAGRKCEEARKVAATELELFRANYMRSSKETDSYRQQIIELQNNTARQVGFMFLNNIYSFILPSAVSVVRDFATAKDEGGEGNPRRYCSATAAVE